MKLFEGLKKLLGGSVKNSFLIGDAPEGTPVYFMSTNLGQNSCMWVHQWCKITEKEGPLRFPKDGTFELQIIDKLREVLCAIKTPSRAAQFEALSMWEKAARDKASEDKKVKHQTQEKGINDDKKLQINSDDGDKIMDALLTECAPLYVVPIKNTDNSVPVSTTVATASVEQREIQNEKNVQIFQIDQLPVDSALTVIPPGVTASIVTDSVQILQATDAQAVPRKIVTVPINMVPIQKVQRVAEGVSMSGFISEPQNSQIIEQKLPQTVQALKGVGKMAFITPTAQDKMKIFGDEIFQTCFEEAAVIKKIESIGEQINPDPEKERQLPICLSHENVNQCQEKELISLSKETTTCAVTTHDRLTDLAQKYENNVSGSFPLQKSFRVHMNDEVNETMCSSEMQLHIAEIMKYIFKCNGFEKLGDKWARKHEKKKKPPDLVEENNKQDEGEAFAYSLREMVGEVHVHVPRNKSELATFLNTFPKLRDRPILWYPQVNGFVELLKELCINLKMIFDTAMQTELWFESKVVVQRPGEETMKSVCMNTPSFSVVMEKNEAVNTFLKGRVLAKDGVQTKRTTQKLNEMVQLFAENENELQCVVSQAEIKDAQAKSGVSQARGRGVLVGANSGMDVAVLEKVSFCHLCNRFEHWKKKCKFKIDVANENAQTPQRKIQVQNVPAQQMQMSVQKQVPMTGVFQAQMLPQNMENAKINLNQLSRASVNSFQKQNKNTFQQVAVFENESFSPNISDITKSIVKTVEGSDLPHLGKNTKVAGKITNPVLEKVSAKLGPFDKKCQIVVCDSGLAGKQLFCKLNSTDYCRTDDVNFQIPDEDVQFKMAQQKIAVAEMTVEKLPSNLKEIIKTEVREFTGKNVRLIKSAEHVLFKLEPDDMYSRTLSVVEILPIIGDKLSKSFLMELIGSLCNFLITGFQKLNEDNRIVQEPCCPVVPNPANIFFHIPCAEEWLTVIDFCQVHVTVPLHENSQEYCQKEDEFLGHIIGKGARKVSPERVETIHQINPPQIQKEVRMYLGMGGCCSEWLPNLSLVAKPLLRLTHKDVSDPLPLDNNCTKAFLELTEKKCRAPALGMKVYLNENTPICSEREGCALSVPVLKHECVQKSVTYLPMTLDPSVTEMPSCLNLVAVVNVSHKKSENIMMEFQSTEMVPSFVKFLLENTVIKSCLNSNVFSLLPANEIVCDENEHECLDIMNSCMKQKLDFKDERLIQPNNVHFVDSSCLKGNSDILRAAHAVLPIHYVVKASWLSVVTSAQNSKLFALTITCSITTQMGVTVVLGKRNANSVAKYYVLLAYAFNGIFTCKHEKDMVYQMLMSIIYIWKELKEVQENVSETEQQGCIKIHFEKNEHCIVANVLLQKLMPRYRLPVSLKSDHNEVSKMMCAEPQIGQRLDCSYLPEVSSIIKQHKDSTESHFAKDCVSASPKWLEFEYANALVKTTDENTSHCCEGLTDVECAVSHQIAAATQDLHNGWCNDFDLRDVKWKGLFQMILAKTVVKCGGLPNWVHASYTRMGPCPLDETAPLQEKMPAVVKSPQKRVSQAVRERTECEAALHQTEVALEKQKVETDSDERSVKRVNESGAASEEENSAVGLQVEVEECWLKGYPKRLQWSLEKSFAPIAETSESEQGENKSERFEVYEDHEYRVTDPEGQTDDEQPSTSQVKWAPATGSQEVAVKKIVTKGKEEGQTEERSWRKACDTQVTKSETEGQTEDRPRKRFCDTEKESEAKGQIEERPRKRDCGLEKEGEESQIKESLRKRATEWSKSMEKVHNATLNELYEPP